MPLSDLIASGAALAANGTTTATIPTSMHHVSSVSGGSMASTSLSMKMISRSIILSIFSSAAQSTVRSAGAVITSSSLEILPVSSSTTHSATNAAQGGAIPNTHGKAALAALIGVGGLVILLG